MLKWRYGQPARHALTDAEPAEYYVLWRAIGGANVQAVEELGTVSS